MTVAGPAPRVTVQRNTQRCVRFTSCPQSSPISEDETALLHIVFCLVSYDCHSERTQDCAAGVGPVLYSLGTRLGSGLRVAPH